MSELLVSTSMHIHKDFEAMLTASFGETLKNRILDAYSMEPVRGIRMNPLKAFENPFEGERSVLNESVFIAKEYAKTVTHPLSHAGSYYIQDPSATTPVMALKLDPADVVIDLCAAPGGKSTYILSEIPQGFLISNDIDSKRNQRLVHNMDRWGHENVVVTCSNTQNIAKEWPATFDKVLLDAPCSGEGLFRRDRGFAASYKLETAVEFANLQSQLIEDAYTLTKDKGVLVYSTCTLNTLENEGVVKQFLDNHPECYLEPTGLKGGFKGMLGLDETTRFIPDEHGEGHFIARIRVIKPESKTGTLTFKSYKESTEILEKINLQGNFYQNKDALFALKGRGYIKTKLPVTRDGVLVGYYKKSHFEFDHAISQSVAFKDSFKSLDVDLQQAYAYLHGHQLETNLKGLFCVTFEGHSLGFAKGNGLNANNRYPKGLRNKFLSY